MTSSTDSRAELAPLLVVPWEDPIVDELGFDPRSEYVEAFWLPLLGPTSTWLMRRFAVEFDTSPAGFSLDVVDAARSIGIGTRGGRSGPFPRSVDRCIRFGLAHHGEHDILTVRRRFPVLSRSQVRRLPARLRDHHDTLAAGDAAPASGHGHAVRLARSLLDVGASHSEVTAQLRRWGFDEVTARDAMRAALTLGPTVQAS